LRFSQFLSQTRYFKNKIKRQTLGKYVQIIRDMIHLFNARILLEHCFVEQWADFCGDIPEKACENFHQQCLELVEK
jgi:hypothetical protein